MKIFSFIIGVLMMASGSAHAEGNHVGPFEGLQDQLVLTNHNQPLATVAFSYPGGSNLICGMSIRSTNPNTRMDLVLADLDITSYMVLPSIALQNNAIHVRGDYVRQYYMDIITVASKSGRPLKALAASGSQGGHLIATPLSCLR